MEGSEGRGVRGGCSQDVKKKIEFGSYSLASAHLPSASMDLPSPDSL